MSETKGEFVRPISRLVFVGFAFALLAMPAAAHATFPGSNGKIAFVRNDNVWISNPDGSGLRQMTTEGQNTDPAWSADGQRIPFASNRDGNNESYSMDANTGAQTRLTNDAASDTDPTWSPDGQKIAFVRADPSSEIYVMNADGTGVTTLTNGQGGYQPDWSPDGQKIAFAAFDVAANIYAINPDGTGRAAITHFGPGSRVSYHQGSRPDWSPDGASLVFVHAYGGGGTAYADLNTINADGSDMVDLACCFEGQPVYSPDGKYVLFEGSGYYLCAGLCVIPSEPPVSSGEAVPVDGNFPDWQPGPAGAPTPSGFPHPARANQVRVSLVPAFRQCNFPGDYHGPPLGWQSCNPPRTTSDYLTVGTPDANGKPARSSGWVQYDVILDDTTTPADETDVRISIKVTDVRRKDDLSDYTGELWTLVEQQITDLNNPGALGDSGTMEEQPMTVEAPCAATVDPSVGSTCQVTTTVDSLATGAVVAGEQGVWELNRVEVYDGGADGDRDTGVNTLFMQQGVYAP